MIIAALLASTLECFLTLPAHLKSAFKAMERDRLKRPHMVARFFGAIRWGVDKGFMFVRDVPVAFLVRLSYRWRYVTVAMAISLLIASFAMLQSGGSVSPFSLRRSRSAFSPMSPSRLASLKRPGWMPSHGSNRRRSIRQRSLRGKARPSSPIIFRRLGQSGQSRGENLGRIDIELTPGEERTIRTDAFIAAFRKNAPNIVGVERLSIAGQRGGPPGSDIDVRLTGASVDVLKRAALDLQNALEAVPGLTGVSDDLPFGKPDIVMELTPRGRFLGMTTQSVASQVRAAYEGAIAMRFARGDEEVAVRVRQLDDGKGAAGLRDLMIRTPAGGSVRLEEVVSFREQRAFSVLQRRDGKTAVAVTANVTPGVAQADVVIASLRSTVLPELQQRYGVDFAFEGRAQTQREAFADLRIGAAVALALIFLILAFVFQSWFQPVLVMLIIPFGFVGTIFGHWWMGFDMALFSFIGLLGLSGVLVNGAIVLVDRMNERVAEGEALEPAATGAAVDRFRALFLTTATTVGGMVSLLLEKSLQAQFLIPIAITMTFGLAFATILVLFLTPSLIGIADDIRRVLKAFWLLLRGPTVRQPSVLLP